MALIAHSDLPAFASLRAEGIPLISPDEVDGQRPLLHVGLLNLMPDAALRATDRQFLRLVAAGCEQIDVHVHPFTVAAEARSATAQHHVEAHYESAETVLAGPLDALIVTGANPACELLQDESFWAPLCAVLDSAVERCRSILCSCLATHAVVEHRLGQRRQRLPVKQWGVYEHEAPLPAHPLLEGIDLPVFAPHSHHFDLSRERMEAIGLEVLLWSAEAGVHLATAKNGTDWVFFQGHPEYDAISLLKEYKREIARFIGGERGYPLLPEHYFPPAAQAMLRDYQMALQAALDSGREAPPLPEERLSTQVKDTWGVAGRRVYRNWLRQLAGLA